MTELALPAGRLHALGYGEDRPIASNDTSAGRKRTVVSISSFRLRMKAHHARPGCCHATSLAMAAPVTALTK